MLAKVNNTVKKKNIEQMEKIANFTGPKMKNATLENNSINTIDIRTVYLSILNSP